ncbi:MAG: DUF4332 domain-containing protein [Tunicatimonas sp.]
MSTKITSIDGIGVQLQKKLAKANIRSVEGLLKEGCTKKGRKSIAETSGIDEKKLLDLVNMADLFRIKGVSTQYAELLKASGVDTVKELRTRKPENLQVKMAETNQKKKLTRVVPSVKMITKFVEGAKEIDPMVTH